MSRNHRVTAIIGSTSTTSRTRVLVESIVDALALLRSIEVTWVELSKLAHHIGPALSPKDLPPEGMAAIEAIEQADLVIAASLAQTEPLPS